MTTADPISLSQAKRLAASADTIRLRATRPADLETPIGAFLRLDTAIRHTSSSRSRAASAWAATRSWASVPVACSRSAMASPDPDEARYGPDLQSGPAGRHRRGSRPA